MDCPVVVITGGAGFLGSAVTVDLARDHQVVAIDRRRPSAQLAGAAPAVRWWQADIAHARCVDSAFARARQQYGRVDFVVHLAAFYHFGTDWRREYQRTNLEGTAHVLRAARSSGVRRFLFASSIAAMLPAPPGECLTENTPATDYIPYARSKAMGEALVHEASERMPAAVLRIGGAFSDWSELPPLSALVRLWAGRGPLRCIVVGRGQTGMPYIHRLDVARVVRRVIERHRELGPYEVFLACQDGAVLHQDLFRAVAKADAAGGRDPIHLPPGAARLGLHARRAFAGLVGDPPYERPWMLQYIDRPWVADTRYTRNKLDWQCTEGMGVLDRLPVILSRFRHERRAWERRNRLRDEGRYVYCAES